MSMFLSTVVAFFVPCLPAREVEALLTQLFTRKMLFVFKTFFDPCSWAESFSCFGGLMQSVARNILFGVFLIVRM